jgi:NAD(P)-dependent dehydrogenase (short-subunit alcohol dehydrogenase family)
MCSIGKMVMTIFPILRNNEKNRSNMNQTNKIILITGGTNGIGKAAAAQLAALGHSVVIVGRSREKCIATAESLCRETGGQVDWLLADLSSLAQVRGLAEEFQRRYDRLDVLINNAGAVYGRRLATADGMEMGWTVNYLQSFLLTRQLLDLLKASAPARIINLSSIYHWAARLNLDNLEERGLYLGWTVYARCKLASLYFTYELSRRLEGSGVTANAIHPGLVKTGIGKTSGWLLRSVFRFVDLFAIPPEKGAQGLANLAVNPTLAGVSGQYFSGLNAVSSSPVSYDREMARRLWEISINLTKAY